MSSLSCEYAAADIGVLWDVEDCPIPSGLTLDSIRDNIRHALQKLGYCGSVSITAYSALHRKESDFNPAGIKLKPMGAKCKRVDKILMDCYSWALGHRKQTSNLLVISKDLSADEGYVDGFTTLKEYRHNVLVASNCNASGQLCDLVSDVWLWPSLAIGGSPLSDQVPSSAASDATTPSSDATPSSPLVTVPRRRVTRKKHHKKHRTKPYVPKAKA